MSVNIRRIHTVLGSLKRIGSLSKVVSQHQGRISSNILFSRSVSGTGEGGKMIEPPDCLFRPLEVPEKLLMGPGPSNAPPRVLEAGKLPLLGHLHSEFTQIMDEVKAGIQYALQTTNRFTLAVSATGHGAMEAACCNMVEEGDVVLVAQNGIWGERFGDMADRHGAIVHKVTRPAGEVFSLYDLEVALSTYRPSVMFITHGESSGTTCQPLAGIGKLCHNHGCLLIVDSVAAMGGVPMYMDDWEIDVAYSGAQKVLSAPPGASPISFSEAAWKKIQERQTKVRSFYFDMNWLANYWGCDGQPRKYHHTGPISSIYALREGLAILAAEGLVSCWDRHRRCADKLENGLTDMRLELFVKDPSVRLGLVTGVKVPASVDFKKVIDYAMKHHCVEISGGLGETAGKIWRIGLMGHNAQEQNVGRVLVVLQEAIARAQTSKL